MINMIRSIIFSAIFFAIPALFIPGSATAQTTVTASLINQFEQYQVNHLQEKLFVHTDKTFYLAGERIWFKLYLLDGILLQPLSLSKVAYVEVMDKDNKPVLQTKISLAHAAGNGSLLLPASMTSGNYMLRAYTQWMKNYGPHVFYEQQLTVINTLKENIIIDSTKKTGHDIHFFPEAGNLVGGLTSTIAFKITGPNAHLLSCKGIITDEKKDSIAAFNTLLFGMGSVAFTPKYGIKYQAVAECSDGSKLVTALPQVYQRGMVLNLAKKTGGLIHITVRGTSNFDNTNVFLFAHSRQSVQAVQSAALVNGVANFSFNDSQLADGVSQFTLFNADKQPVCERLYFKRPVAKLSLALSTDKPIYQAREKVTVSVTAADELKEPVAAELSMSVFLIDSLQTTDYNDITSYLYLQSELKGTVIAPTYYFDEKSPFVDEATDNLLLTQGWRRFNWEDVLQNKQPSFEFLPEQEGILVTGKIVQRNNGISVANVPAYLTIPGQYFQFIPASSSKNGRLRFSTKYFVGTTELILQANPANASAYSIELDSPFSPAFSGNKPTPFSLSPDTRTKLTNRHIAMQVENTYNVKEKTHFLPVVNKDSTAFYGTPSHFFYLDEYTRFNTMEEVLKEFVTDVRVRKKDGHFNIRILNRASLSFFPDEPLVLIDGLPVFDMDKVLQVNPANIKKVDIIAKQYYNGAGGYDGIISYRSYDGDMGGYTLPPDAVVVKFDGLQQQREFYNPGYETATSRQIRIPDLRNVLYWNPAIKTGKDGTDAMHFFSSDIAGKFAILLQGNSTKSRTGSQLITIQVQDPSPVSK